MIGIRSAAWLVCVAVVSTQALLRGQQPSSTSAGGSPAFEVASVKPNRSSELRIQVDMPGSDRFTATNIPLRELIRFAYDVPNVRLLGGPDWIGSERFDIVAKADRALPAWGPTGPPTEVLRMLRTLLANRFGLVVHQEVRELPVYVLSMARDDRRMGPAIRSSTLDCEKQTATRQPGPPPARANVAQPTCGMRIGPGQMVIGGAPMGQLATVLSSFVQRVVIDRTELAGAFDLQLSWTPDQGRLGGPPPPGAPPLPPLDPNGASIFAALQEQLGLKLEPLQAPVDVVVIDRVDRPTAD